MSAGEALSLYGCQVKPAEPGRRQDGGNSVQAWRSAYAGRDLTSS